MDNKIKNKILIGLGIFLGVILILLLIYFFYNENLKYDKNIFDDYDEYEEDELDRNDFDEEYVICIDPGHGGEVSETAPDLQEEEKEDVLLLGLALRDLFDRTNVKVIMTRDSDVSVELEERAKIANDNNCDLFISLHRNISDVGDDINGAETWKALNKGEVCDILADNIQEELVEFGFNDRKVREGSQSNSKTDYIVNKETNMPSVLLELGFMTNDYDNDLFRNNIDDLAKAIYNGIVETLREMSDKE